MQRPLLCMARALFAKAPNEFCTYPHERTRKQSARGVLRRGAPRRRMLALAQARAVSVACLCERCFCKKEKKEESSSFRAFSLLNQLKTGVRSTTSAPFTQGVNFDSCFITRLHFFFRAMTFNSKTISLLICKWVKF